MKEIGLGAGEETAGRRSAFLSAFSLEPAMTFKAKVESCLRPAEGGLSDPLPARVASYLHRSTGGARSGPEVIMPGSGSK